MANMSFESSINIYNFYQNSAQNTTKLKPDEAENSGIYLERDSEFTDPLPQSLKVCMKNTDTLDIPVVRGKIEKKRISLRQNIAGPSTPMAETYLIVTYEYYDMALKN